jgi:hypothetical protein
MTGWQKGMDAEENLTVKAAQGAFEELLELAELGAQGKGPELLAVDEENAFVGAVDHHQLRDGAAGGDLGDGDLPARQGFAECAVLECAVRRGDEGQDGDVFVRLRFSELN